MLNSCDTADSLFPPTELYNEGWLLRIFLDWFSTHRVDKHPLSFSEGARWFSEALLLSAFLPRSREDPLGESRTHADGVIGHFVGQNRELDQNNYPTRRCIRGKEDFLNETNDNLFDFAGFNTKYFIFFTITGERVSDNSRMQTKNLFFL
jgi:hypothetical protein